ncbi:MAG TPA: phosphoribosylglycinamide formyltransferase [Firmicutes bacterium]|nr:phosphoribosylglycinamide formyltransferase [Bacillota bacterium]
MKNIAVFASGSGSDMQSVIDACESGQINGKVVAVIASRPGIFALERAAKHNIPSKVFSVKEYGSPEAKDGAIVEYLKPMGIDLIVLAGYLSIVSKPLLDMYEGRIINIHPSLIPRHCGKGMYGLHVHESVLASGDKVSGCTVHFVDSGTDTGKIIRQVTVPVEEGDTPETLQARVLVQEHKLLPQVVAELCK